MRADHGVWAIPMCQPSRLRGGTGVAGAMSQDEEAFSVNGVKGRRGEGRGKIRA